jgi:hypothetical protein
MQGFYQRLHCCPSTCAEGGVTPSAPVDEVNLKIDMLTDEQLANPDSGEKGTQVPFPSGASVNGR